ncbi:MAG: hypothetical protein IJA85_07755 [Clostridia bacterium]|nr:hypothetical protein [Clostridia bacterium]
MNTFSLDGCWRMAWAKHDVPIKCDVLTSIAAIETAELCTVEAKVPGNAELSLSEADILPYDLFFGDNILLVQAYEDCHFWYYRSFDAVGFGAGDAIRFEGIDTIAEIYLNGELLGKTENMFIPHEFSLPALREKGNELVVHILPVCIEARKYPVDAGSFAQRYNYDSLQIRKAGHCFGWDIMPRVVSAGIWRPVMLVEKKEERIEEIYFYTLRTDCTAGSAVIGFYHNLVLTGGNLKDYQIRVEGVCGESSFSSEQDIWHTCGRYPISIDDAKFWWPRSMGDANLYNIKVTLLRCGEVIDTKQLRFGIRTVRLERTSLTDREGNGQFRFHVNGQPFFVKGTNWVPVDAFHSRDRERLPQILPMLTDIGCNAVRCWGGNVYEDDLFYDFCDENGIAVWQDFAMGCGVYPQDERFQKQLSDEAGVIIRQLRNHPSIILWAGDNECDLAYSWGGAMRDPNKNVLTRRVLPEAVERHDPYREYLPSSPYIDQTAYDSSSGSQDALPEQHCWGPRDYYKSAYYKDNFAHFASEMGYHGCNSPRSIKKFISPDSLWPWQDNREWLVHAATPDGSMKSPYAYRIRLMSNQVRDLFGEEPDNLEDYAAASQIVQAEAFKFFIERFRYAKWRRSGIIWWNLIDGWPQFSDAVVDYYGDRKLAYSYIKRAQTDVCMMCAEPSDGMLPLHAVNDRLTDEDISYTVTDLVSGECLREGNLCIPANSAIKVADLGGVADKQGMILMEWNWRGETYRNHFLTGARPYALEFYRELMEKAGF